MQTINTEAIVLMLRLIRDTVVEAHPDVDDDVGAIVHNCCLGIAEQLDLDL